MQKASSVARATSSRSARYVGVIGVLAIAVAAVAVAARWLPIDNHPVLLVAAVSPYLMCASPVGAVILILSRQWLVAGVAVCLTVVTAFIQLPRYLGTPMEHGAGIAVRVLTVNLKLGQANAEALTRIAEDNADIMVTQEVTPDAVARLRAAGVDNAFPYHALDPGDDASGVGIWTRWPTSDTDRIRGYEFALISTRIGVPGAAAPATVVSAHISGPWPQPIDLWREELAKFPTTMHDLAQAAGAGSVVVAGDFNSTLDMHPFRNLLRDGYRDAAEQSGAGLTASFPADEWVPPFIGIDHVLTYQSAASSARTIRVPGSDHLGLLATVAIPASATAG